MAEKLELMLDSKRITAPQWFDVCDEWRVKAIVYCSNTVLNKQNIDCWGALPWVLINPWNKPCDIWAAAFGLHSKCRHDDSVA